jgi:hypothetical protein
LFKLVGPLDSFTCKQDVQDELEWWKNELILVHDPHQH